MTRTHRRAHRVIWIGVALAVSLGFALAIGLRPAPAGERAVQAAEIAR